MDKGKGFISEFKEFISRGSVVDLAVGVIIGGAFTAIVTSLVNDIIMPVIGWCFGGIDFTGLRYIIAPATDTADEAAIFYGNFIQNLVNFILVAFVIFMVVKIINRFHKKKDEDMLQEEEPAKDIQLLEEIRDLLKATKDK